MFDSEALRMDRDTEASRTVHPNESLMTEAMVQGVESLVIFQEENHYSKPNAPDEISQTMYIIQERIKQCSLKYEKQKSILQSKKQKELTLLQQSYQKHHNEWQAKCQKEEQIMIEKYKQDIAKMEKESQQSFDKVEEAKKKEIQLYTSTILSIPPPSSFSSDHPAMNWYDWIYNNLFSVK